MLWYIGLTLFLAQSIAIMEGRPSSMGSKITYNQDQNHDRYPGYKTVYPDLANMKVQSYPSLAPTYPKFNTENIDENSRESHGPLYPEFDSRPVKFSEHTQKKIKYPISMERDRLLSLAARVKNYEPQPEQTAHRLRYNKKYSAPAKYDRKNNFEIILTSRSSRYVPKIQYSKSKRYEQIYRQQKAREIDNKKHYPVKLNTYKTGHFVDTGVSYPTFQKASYSGKLYRELDPKYAKKPDVQDTPAPVFKDPIDSSISAEESRLSDAYERNGYEDLEILSHPIASSSNEPAEFHSEPLVYEEVDYPALDKTTREIYNDNDSEINGNRIPSSEINSDNQLESSEMSELAQLINSEYLETSLDNKEKDFDGHEEIMENTNDSEKVFDNNEMSELAQLINSEYFETNLDNKEKDFDGHEEIVENNDYSEKVLDNNENDIDEKDVKYTLDNNGLMYLTNTDRQSYQVLDNNENDIGEKKTQVSGSDIAEKQSTDALETKHMMFLPRNNRRIISD